MREKNEKLLNTYKILMCTLRAALTGKLFLLPLSHTHSTWNAFSSFHPRLFGAPGPSVKQVLGIIRQSFFFFHLEHPKLTSDFLL